MTNLEKEAIARKQNLAGVVKENKTGRMWGASIRGIIYRYKNDMKGSHHRILVDAPKLPYSDLQ